MSPAFKPTAEQRESVELMISYGAPEAEICLLIKNPQTGKPIEVETLREHFASEIAHRRHKAEVAARQSHSCSDARARWRPY